MKDFLLYILTNVDLIRMLLIKTISKSMLAQSMKENGFNGNLNISNKFC